MQDILYPIIEHYIGAKVTRVERETENIFFTTLLGQGGKIEKNVLGDWDLVVDDEKVAEIEDVLFSTFCENDQLPPITKYYSKLVDLKSKHLNYRSNLLIEQLLSSVRYLVLNMDVELDRPMEFGPFFIFSHDGSKNILVLN